MGRRAKLGVEMTATGDSASLCLRADVRLRREHFGGLAYDPRKGDTVELDRGAFRLLELARAGISVRDAWETIVAEGLERKLKERDLEHVVTRLLDLGLLSELTPSFVPTPPVRHTTKGWPQGPGLSGPEGAHWAITYRCRADCPDCYAARHRAPDAPESTTEEALRLVDSIADMGAFQLAIGGGEPLVREDLTLVVRAARHRGLCVHVTTSGDGLDEGHEDLLENVTCLHIGIRHQDLLAGEGQVFRLRELCSRVGRSGAVVGANLVLCRSVLARFDEALSRIVDAGFARLTLLRYKPPATVARWLEESPSVAELEGLEDRIAAFQEHHPELVLRIDCALSFLERRLPLEIARAAALRGCVAGSRILAVGPDGSVYPCSQLVHPRFAAGNLLSDEAAEVWRSSSVLKKYRFRRQKRAYRQTLCSACLAREQCGGCAALSDNGLGADPGCPEPLLPPLHSLGRDGRVADLGRWLDGRAAISVAQYMDRYGVGQKRAVAELRRFPGLHLEAPDGSGKSKADCYVLENDDPIGEIQQMIGFTDGGAPYATREEVASWIDLPAERAYYPRWLREPCQPRAERPRQPAVESGKKSRRHRCRF